jgi:uncharacterized protein
MSVGSAVARISGSGFSAQQIAGTLSRRIQQLILLPTEQCNFRCTYCYEDFVLGRMSEATQRAIERLLERRIPELKQLSLSWFGGEPLVAKDVVLRIAAFAHRLCERCGTDFSGGLTTNGYLLRRELFEELVSLRQNFFQITLDGFGEAHDAVRKRAGGRGSFDRIWSNLLDMRSVNARFRINLRIHVRRERLDALPLLMKELGHAFADDPRFVLEFEALKNLGGAGGKTVQLPITRVELKQIERQCREAYAAHRIPQSSPITGAPDAQKGAALDLTAEDQYICYAAKANSLLIRSDGRIGKCTVALEDDRNTIGKIRDDGTVEIDQEKLAPWLRGLDSLDAAMLSCPLHGLPR